MGNLSQLKEMNQLDFNEKGYPMTVRGYASLGFFMSDRDVVNNFKWEQVEGDKFVFGFVPGQHPDYPETEGVVRMKMTLAAENTIEGNALRVKHWIHGDPGGYVPTGLLNTINSTL